MTDDSLSILQEWAWNPFGFGSPFTCGQYGPGGGVDTTISVNTSIPNIVQYYRDLTINSGIVLSQQNSVQIIICRTLKFGSATAQISANSQGAGGGSGAASAAGGGGNGAAEVVGGVVITGTLLTTAPGDWSCLLASGGAGGNPTVVGNNYQPQGLLGMLNGYLLQGCFGGGGGGAGGGGITGGGTGLGGLRGGAGQTGTTVQIGGGGGSGFGGGGGGGNSGSAVTGGTGGSGGFGGGVLIVICDKIIGSAGLLTANGAPGVVPSVGTNAGGGGGGGGGAVLLYVRDGRAVTPTLQANGGAGAAGLGSGISGANGGNGFTQILRGI